MTYIQTILHPNDLSETSHAAFRLACALARDYQAEIIVLHVYPPPVNGADAVDRDRSDEIERDVLVELKNQTPHDASIRVTYRVEEGVAADLILETADECELVVMGTHGRSGVSRALMGSVAEHVLRQSPCPVVTVKPTVKLPKEAGSVSGRESEGAVH